MEIMAIGKSLPLRRFPIVRRRVAKEILRWPIIIVLKLEIPLSLTLNRNDTNSSIYYLAF
ncbi:MAG: hypothetical protein QW520_01195 [Methanomassiliicoccales archaeon]